MIRSDFQINCAPAGLARGLDKLVEHQRAQTLISKLGQHIKFFQPAASTLVFQTLKSTTQGDSDDYALRPRRDKSEAKRFATRNFCQGFANVLFCINDAVFA